MPPALRAAEGRLLLICNPNSPSGTFTPLEVIDDLATRFDGVVVVDEAYVDFARESALSLVRECHNVVVLRTFSKSFSLAGMRIGLAFAMPGIIAELAKVRVQQPDGSFAVEQGMHVEPVQLQVVCRRLWAAMPADDLSIDVEDLEQYASVSTSLGEYYAEQVGAIAAGDARAECHHCG